MKAAGIYTIDGKRIANDDITKKKGLYIVVTDGAVRKVMVK